MFPGSSRKLLSLVLGLSLISFTYAAGQGPFISPACVAICNSEVTCEQDCQVKLDLYDGYMAQLGFRVTPASLTQLYIDILQPFYPGADLRSWRFGFGDRQPAGNATTDCSITYFNNSQFVTRLLSGQLASDDDFGWLFHELQHYVQCNSVGGRAAYAVMWFRELGVTFVEDADLATLHDRMPMEADADAVRDSVFAAVAASRGSDGRLRRAMAMELRRNGQVIEAVPFRSIPNIPQNVSQTIVATVTGFSSPPPVRWSVKRPEHPFSSLVAGGGANGEVFQWTPNERGVHYIRVTAGSVTSTAESLTRMVSFRVLAPGEAAPNATPPKNLYETVTAIPKPLRVGLEVKVNRPSMKPVTICVDDNESGAVYARSNIYTSAGQFTVRKNREFKVVVSGSGLAGKSQVVAMGDTPKKITVTLVAGSGGPICGGLQ